MSSHFYSNNTFVVFLVEVSRQRTSASSGCKCVNSLISWHLFNIVDTTATITREDTTNIHDTLRLSNVKAHSRLLIYSLLDSTFQLIHFRFVWRQLSSANWNTWQQLCQMCQMDWLLAGRNIFKTKQCNQKRGNMYDVLPLRTPTSLEIRVTSANSPWRWLR